MEPLAGTLPLATAIVHADDLSHITAEWQLLSVDVAIGVATTIALRGYHRAEMPHGRVWEEDVLEQIAAVSRHLADLLHQDARA